MLQNIPQQSWDFALVCNAWILSMTAQGKDRIPGLKKLTGETYDTQSGSTLVFATACGVKTTRTMGSALDAGLVSLTVLAPRHAAVSWPNLAISSPAPRLNTPKLMS